MQRIFVAFFLFLLIELNEPLGNGEMHFWHRDEDSWLVVSVMGYFYGDITEHSTGDRQAKANISSMALNDLFQP